MLWTTSPFTLTIFQSSLSDFPRRKSCCRRPSTARMNPSCPILMGSPEKYQSDEGTGLGSWTCISFSQQVGVPSPAFVHRISVLQTSQRYLFPSWLTCHLPKLLFLFHRLTATTDRPLPCAGYNELRPAFFANISFPHLICHLASHLPNFIHSFILTIKIACNPREVFFSKPSPRGCVAKTPRKSPTGAV